ncbi:MAG: hypothetical protein ACOYYI_01690 [Chloroflexota bacterium]|jgi:hypothetical protein
MNAKQKRSRGNGSKVWEAVGNRQRNYSTAWQEIFNILRDIRAGNLPLMEVPRFVVWLLRGGLA